MIQFDEHIFQTGWNHQLVYLTIIFDIMGISGYPPKAKPNKPLLREINGYSNSPLIRPYFLGGGGIGGVPLDSHHISFLNPPGLTEGSFIISSILLLLGGGAGLVLGMKAPQKWIKIHLAEPVVSVDFLQGNESRDHGKWDLTFFWGGDQRIEIYGKIWGISRK